MNRKKIHQPLKVLYLLTISVILLCSSQPVASQNAQDSNENSGLIYKSMDNFTSMFKAQITKHLAFCITDTDDDWDHSFNFSKHTEFLVECAKVTQGDMGQRLCSEAEIEFYMSAFQLSGKMASRGDAHNLKPNTNCNLSSWVEGCEPGWACSSGVDISEVKNRKEFPVRTMDCKPCCEGFFCPKGITCMIPCPLGAYCPLAKLNNSTGQCDPYTYQLPHGDSNHTCGGADVWADIVSGGEIFCSAGSYCPSTIQKIPCSSGHYCRAGSTYQEECLWLASCDRESANQNITIYGLLLFVGLSVLVIIIYSCSDQVIATREKRIAKSREKAVRSVRETAQIHDKWQSAKDMAKSLQTQLSRTFSRRKTLKHPEQTKSSGPAKSAGLPPLAGGGSCEPASNEAQKERSNLTEMLDEIEKNPESHGGFSLTIGDKNIKQQPPKGKQLHTQSQMFRYVYDQIEKEKAMHEENKNLTFSGVISMANVIQIRKRPTIEVSFKDLTITLRGKNKHLMRCVTGKLSPGRISAVMGPSGAGKTTFLSALRGRVPGCTMTGTILVNGKVDPIQSYKRIIGFVPQDDIVHGNLTVEENLWFSARCRLPADLPKAEKVLVVERVIESLGLQLIRDSLVGTVEKRGISGGQKKRVNVGLEMVMEPSLLILDEPTSGLDSASSQLLLRALRREALEGVNVCMVLHQPSYTLFRMFDDFILLAKGGLTVYHGPVKKVEQYFASLGITVPDRVNPPDYFIDILEGIEKPNTKSGIDYKQLPARWMIHNGYPVPRDMLRTLDEMSGTASGNLDQGDNDDKSEVHSFAGDFWQDVKFNVELKRDSLHRNFLELIDLSKRKTPGALQQYKYFLARVGRQRLREATAQAIDYLILLLAGICIGSLAQMSDENFGSTGYTQTVIAVSLLGKIAALRSFNTDKVYYWRESASGMSSLAYFLSKDTVDHFNIFIKPIVFLSMFYFFNNPRSSITDNYIVLLCLVYCVTGIAYILAICLEPGPAQLWAVLLPVVLTLLATQTEDNEQLQRIAKICYPKWALEAFVIANAKRYPGVWLITRCGALHMRGYDLKQYFPSLSLLILAGMLGRAVAFFCLLTFQKK